VSTLAEQFLTQVDVFTRKASFLSRIVNDIAERFIPSGGTAKAITWCPQGLCLYYLSCDYKPGNTICCWYEGDQMYKSPWIPKYELHAQGCTNFLGYCYGCWRHSGCMDKTPATICY